MGKASLLDELSSPKTFSTTIVEAKASVDQLHGMIERCYEEMSSRLNRLELRDLERPNGFPVDSHFQSDASSIMTTKGPSASFPIPEPASTSFCQNVLCDFAKILQDSWVYRRNNALDASRLSVYSKDHCSMAWSCLSSGSWAEVSNISVIELPILVNELYNPLRSSQTWSNRHLEHDTQHPGLLGPVLPRKPTLRIKTSGMDEFTVHPPYLSNYGDPESLNDVLYLMPGFSRGPPYEAGTAL